MRRLVARAGSWGVPALALTCGMLTFGPWGGSGEAMRSSYEIIDVAERAGVLPDGLGGWAILWYLVPAGCGATLLAAALDRARLAALLAATIGALVTTGGILVVRSPLTTGGAAAAGALVGAMTMMISTVVATTTGTRGGSDT